MSSALPPTKRVVTVDGGTLDLCAARALARVVMDGGQPAACVVDLGRVRDLQDASLALLAELARAGVEFLGMGEHHRRLLRYLLSDVPLARAGT